MKLITRKIFLDLLKIFTVTALVIISLLSLIQVNLLFTLGINSADLYLKAGEAALYLLPQLFYITSPMALFFSSMILLNNYRKSKRILTLQSLGFSNWQIQKSFLFLGTLLMLINYLMIFTLLPHSSKNFKSLQRAIKEENLIKFLEVKALKTLSAETFFYLEAKNQEALEGIFLLDNRSKNSKVFAAQKGKFIEDGIKLRQGSYQELEDNQVKITGTFDSYNLSLDQKIIGKKKELYELSIYQLINYSGPETNKAAFFLHQRLAWPLYAIFLILIILKIEWFYNYSGDFVRQGSNKAFFLSLISFTMINIAFFFLQTVNHLKVSIILPYFIGPSLLQLLSWMIKLKQKTCSQ